MATTPTNLPVPSETPRDLKFNAGKIDEFVTSDSPTYTDRLGGKHHTIEGIRALAQQAISQYGWILLDSFQDGADITLPNQALRDEATGEYYRWAGPLPKHVDAGSTPATSGGVGATAWVGIGDASLRASLADSNFGDALIAVKQPYTGSVVRTQHSKNADAVSVMDFGATWDGGLRPLSERYATLAEAKAVYPFVTSLSQSIDYAALQAACNSKKTVLVPSGTNLGFVNSTIYLNNSVRIIGENNNSINRAQSFISVEGNISLFALAQGSSSGGTKMIQIFIDGLYIFYNPGTTPTNAANDGGKIAFNFYSTEAGTTGLEMSVIKNVTVHGAWRCYGDSTGTYLTKLQNVWSRNCHEGFIKALGTTMLLESCYALGNISPYQFGAVMAVTMINCAMDQSNITLAGGSLGGAGAHFVNCHAVNIMGADVEGNIVSTDGGGDAALFHFENSNAKVSGLTAWKNQLRSVAPTVTGVVSFIKASGTSHVITDSSEDDLSNSAIAYTGSGYPTTLYAKDATSRIDVMSGRWRQPAGGSPVISVVSNGNVGWFCKPISGVVAGGGYTQETSGEGIKTLGFYSNKGSVAVTAATATTLFSLPAVEGVYLISTWASGSGTNYSSIHLAAYEGSAVTLTAIKNNPTFTTFTVSGQIVAIQTAGSTTIKWTYTKIG